MQTPEDVQAMLTLASLDVYGGKLVAAQALPGIRWKLHDLGQLQ